MLYKDNPLYPVDYGVDLFQMVELTEIMRQRDDIPVANALNSLWTRVVKQPLSNKIDAILNECIREG